MFLAQLVALQLLFVPFLITIILGQRFPLFTDGQADSGRTSQVAVRKAARA